MRKSLPFFLDFHVLAGELVGCGIRRTCVRLCGYYQSSPICSLDEAEYVLIIEIDPSLREAQITIGGFIRDPQVCRPNKH